MEATQDTHFYRSIWLHMHATPFRQGWIDAGGISTRYCDAGPETGATQTVIMLHGTGGTWEAFCAAIPGHAKHFRCLAIDMVGSGFTDKPDKDYEIRDYVEHVLDFMNAMKIERASLMGVSLGAWVACQFALDHPDRVEKLVLVALSGMQALAATMAGTRAQRGRAVNDPNWDTIKPIFNNLIYDEKNRIDDLVAIRLAAYSQPEMKTAMQHILCLQDPEIRPRNLIPEAAWKSLDQPALIIGAPDDSTEFYQNAKQAAAWMPRAQYLEVPHVKHWAQFEEPKIFNDASVTFLAGDL